MKHIPLLAVAFLSLFLVSSVFAVGPKAGDCDEVIYNYSDDGWHFDNDISIDFDDGDIIFMSEKYDDGEIIITEDYKLYIDGDRIELNDEQQEILVEYYDTFEEIMEHATEIGMKGAAIGVEGAALGISVIGKLIRAALTDYEIEDMERDIEEQAEELEEKAEQLEWDADEIEELAERLEDLQWDLKKETPRLREIEWF